MAEGVHGGGVCCMGCVWWGVHGKGGHVWQERWPLQQTVRILLECILVMTSFYRADGVFTLAMSGTGTGTGTGTGKNGLYGFNKNLSHCI